NIPPPYLHHFPTRRSSDLTKTNRSDGLLLINQAFATVQATLCVVHYKQYSFHRGACHSSEARFGIHSDSGYYWLHLGALRSHRRSEEHTSELQSPYDLVCR